MQPIRVACVQYLNTAPLVEGLDTLEGLTLIPAVPADIAGMLRRDEADVGLASVVDATSGESPALSLLDCGMIGCHGRTLTVRLFSAAPPSEIAELHVDADSHTSVVLARLLLAELYGAEPSVVPFDVRERVAAGGASAEDEGWPASLLVIGDKVVTHSPPAIRYPHQLDLGAAWREWTGLPFVYATWMCRTDDLDEPESAARIRLVADLLDRQRRHNATRLDWLIAQWAPRARWPLDLAKEYVGELLRYEVDGDARRAVERFFELGHRRRLLDSVRASWAALPAPRAPAGA
ncbi:MAG: menaquinone biosynthesis protein [Planctomycetota bacterium]